MSLGLVRFLHGFSRPVSYHFFHLFVFPTAYHGLCNKPNILIFFFVCFFCALTLIIKRNCLSYLTWEWCLRSNDPQRGQVRFPCLLSHTLSSAQTAVARGGALARVLLQQQQRSHGLGRAGSRACNVCGYLERQLLCEVCWE